MNKDARWLMFFIGIAITALIIATPAKRQSPQPIPMTGFENGVMIEVEDMEEAKDVVRELGLEVEDQNERQLFCSGTMTRGIWLILMGHRSVKSVQPKYDRVSSPIK